MQSCSVTDFASWRIQARNLLLRNVPPDQAVWQNSTSSEQSLFDTLPLPAVKPALSPAGNKIPKEFIPFAEAIACHNDPQKWSLLYAMLWRLTHGEKHLLKISSDPLTRTLELMRKAVSRDAHKTKAFVRFREYQDGEGSHYLAWHDPDHDVLPLVEGFFKRRFSVMRWTIMTPYRTVHWDGAELMQLPGVPVFEHTRDDAFENVWSTYYRSTFNPARIKLKMMRSEMPVRYWKTMPETKLISSMLQEAETRVDAMMRLQYSEKTARKIPIKEQK